MSAVSLASSLILSMLLALRPHGRTPVNNGPPPPASSSIDVWLKVGVHMTFMAITKIYSYSQKGNGSMTFVQFFSTSKVQLREWNNVSSPPAFSISPPSEYHAGRSRVHSVFHWINHHVSSQRFPCVICRGRWAEQDKTPGKVKCTQRYWRVTQREKRGVESCVLVQD